MKKNEKLLKKQLEAKKRIENKVDSILFPSHFDSSYKDNPYLALKNINKIYDNNVQAVFDFNLFVNKEEFIVFVGPSGCGKSTTLRMICGLEEITSGGLFIDGVYSNDLAPKDRDIAMVFQSYALYPHMSVYDNLAFSLKIRKIPAPVLDKNGEQVMWVDKYALKKVNKRIKELNQVLKENEEDILQTTKEIETIHPNIYKEMMEYYSERKDLALSEIKKQEKRLQEINSTQTAKYCLKHIKKDVIKAKVDEVAKILEIEPFLTRKPKALSGGQRQRVALGRAIVRDAKVFLMDEPLSNLDAKLRVQMRSELVSLHKKLKATTVYVTHDQTEAMTMADRIVVMKDGVVQQTGTPKEIYDSPRNLFVATFIGAPAMNIIPAHYKDGIITFEDGVTQTCSKNDIVEKFYSSELNRFKQLKTDLDNALMDPNNKNEEVFKLAREKTCNLIGQFENCLKGEFDFEFGIRPEHIYITEESSGHKIVATLVELLGSEYYIHAKIGNTPIVFKTNTKKVIKMGDELLIKFDNTESHGFEKTTTQAIF